MQIPEPTDAELNLLKQLALLRFATIEQIMWLAGIDPTIPVGKKQSSLKVRESKRLKTLVDEDYLLAFERPHEGKPGRVQHVYHLSEKGRNYLYKLGIEASAHKEPGNDILSHILAINDVLVLAHRFTASWGNIGLNSCLHDWDIKKIKDLAVYPDGYFHFVASIGGRDYHGPVFIEVDTGSEPNVSKIMPKIDEYDRFFKTQFEGEFHAKQAGIAFFTLGGELRLKNLQRAIEQKLTALGIPGSGKCFYLTRLLPDLDPTSLFTTPQFLIPFQGNTLFPLLDIANPPPV